MLRSNVSPFSAIVAAIAALPWALLAQQNNPAGSEGDPAPVALEKITVTATKRAVGLTDVALAVSSLSERTLESRGIATLEDLGANTLGMDIVKTGPGENLLVSRGISASQSLSIQSGPAVGVYINEMPLAGIASGVPDFGLWDVSRVEMLRGPQGTLYGEGSMAGTIRIITVAPDSQKPSSKFQLTGSSVAGGTAGQSWRGMLNVPLSPGVAALRATFSYNHDPRWIDAPDLGQKDVNTATQTDGRLAFRLTPSTKTTVDASLWHQRSNAVHSNNQTSPGVYSPPALGIIAGAGVAPLANSRLNTDSRTIDLANVTLNSDLGAFTLVSATSYSKQRLDYMVDAMDTLPIGLVQLGVPASAVRFVVPDATLLNVLKRSLEMTAEELRLVSNGEQRFNWTVGGYFKRLDRHADNLWSSHLPNLPLDDDAVVVSDTRSQSMALFGEGAWRATESVTLTAGLRAYTDDRAATADVKNLSSVFGVPAGVYGPTKVTERQTTYNAIASWKPSPKLNLFARAASGFRSGGPNLWVQDPVNIPKSFKPERIQSLEVGLKSNPTSWLMANAYLYNNDWQDKQIKATTPNGLYDYSANASTANANGAELEVQVIPAPGLSVVTALTYTDATITRDLLSSRGALIAKNGSRLPYVAPWELKLSADYRWRVKAGRTAVGNLTYIHGNSSFSDITNTPATDNGRMNQVNLRAGVESNTKAWGVFGFVRNLTNSQSLSTAQEASAGYGLRYPNYIQPRTIGLELRKEY